MQAVSPKPSSLIAPVLDLQQGGVAVALQDVNPALPQSVRANGSVWGGRELLGRSAGCAGPGGVVEGLAALLV